MGEHGSEKSLASLHEASACLEGVGEGQSEQLGEEPAGGDRGQLLIRPLVPRIARMTLDPMPVYLETVHGLLQLLAGQLDERDVPGGAPTAARHAVSIL